MTVWHQYGSLEKGAQKGANAINSPCMCIHNEAAGNTDPAISPIWWNIDWFCVHFWRLAPAVYLLALFWIKRDIGAWCNLTSLVNFILILY
jgi:hypothetical protein